MRRHSGRASGRGNDGYRSARPVDASPGAKQALLTHKKSHFNHMTKSSCVLFKYGSCMNASSLGTLATRNQPLAVFFKMKLNEVGPGSRRKQKIVPSSFIARMEIVKISYSVIPENQVDYYSKRRIRRQHLFRL